MKTKFALLALLLLRNLFCPAADVRLAWDPSTATGVTNYVIYVYTNAPTSLLGSTNIFAPVRRIDVGTNLTVVVSNVAGGNWIFAATAMKDGDESEISNTVSKEIPTPPQNLRLEPVVLP